MNKKRVKEDTLNKLRQTIAHPSVSALIYGYLKEKNLNLKSMTVDQWKDIEMDLVEIILAETFPGEDISEDQLNFTSLANSIGFMTSFIEKVNSSISSIKEKDTSSENEEIQQNKAKFEV